METLESGPYRALLLIVDDDPTNIGVLYDALAGEELEIVIANDGYMALELASGQPPDLILLDVEMPGLDGYEVCRRLKAAPGGGDIPVVFMTAHDNLEHRVRAFQVGGMDYVTKPFETAVLLARLRTHLSVRRLTKAMQQQNVRLQKEIQERIEGDAEREQLTQTLLDRTEELREAKERLEREFAERECVEVARTALQEQVIAAQRQRLLELSTPLIPITDRIMAIPLIGTMDMQRAQRMMDTALEGAAARRAEWVILDITGVCEVDAGVTDMLVRTGNGLRLLGTRAIITGVSSNVAKMIVELGVPLGSLVTTARLQDGIALAMRVPKAAGSRGY
jgi:DNA-binding response OmpR family regulator